MGCYPAKADCCCSGHADLLDGATTPIAPEESERGDELVFRRLDNTEPLVPQNGSQRSAGELGGKDELDLESISKVEGNKQSGEKAQVEEPLTFAVEEKEEEAAPPSVNKAEVADRNGMQVIPEGTESALEKPAESEPSLPFQDKTFKEFSGKSDMPKKAVPSSLPRRPSTVETQLESYVQRHAKNWVEFEALEPMDGWSLKKQQDGAKVYLKQMAGSSLMSFKAILELPCGIEKLPYVLSELMQVEKRPQWDKMCTLAKTVEAYPPFYRVTYVRLASPAAIISPRDLCLVGRIKFLEDGGCMLHMESFDHPEEPTPSGYVRAKFICGGYIFRPVAGKNAIQAMFVGTVDPSGWLPTWVSNAVAWKQGLALVLFRDSLKL